MMTQVMINPAELSAETMMPKLVCFVCTGNTCRSPMAAAVFNQLAEENKLPMRAVSAGLYVNELSIADNAVRALEAAGIESTPANPYRSHIACNLSEHLAVQCERIVGISTAHAFELITRFPRLAGRIAAMPRDISDPYGGDLERYQQCLREITEGIREMFAL